jgi:hypothetical protein
MGQQQLEDYTGSRHACKTIVVAKSLCPKSSDRPDIMADFRLRAAGALPTHCSRKPGRSRPTQSRAHDDYANENHA